MSRMVVVVVVVVVVGALVVVVVVISVGSDFEASVQITWVKHYFSEMFLQNFIF